MEKSRRGIQSIEIGGTLLTSLVEAGAPMSLGELAKKAGMPAAKAHPYLVSFGSFGLNHRPARIGRNPKSGEKVRVPEKFVPHFKAGKELRERVDTKA